MTICVLHACPFGTGECGCAVQSIPLTGDILRAMQWELETYRLVVEYLGSPGDPSVRIDWPVKFVRLSDDRGFRLDEDTELPPGAARALGLARRMVRAACLYLVQAGIHPDDAEAELHNVAGCELEVCRGAARVLTERLAHQVRAPGDPSEPGRR